MQHVLKVLSRDDISPHLVRVNFGGEAVRLFLAAANPEKLATSDKYVKLLFADPSLGLTPPYDLEALRGTLAPEQMPVRRTYTVRCVDHAAGTIAIEFVVHGDEGVAGPWAASATRGDFLVLSGPGGGFTPSADASVRRLVLGDDSALPAIAAVLEAMPADSFGDVLVEVVGADDELELEHPAGLTVRWLHRGDAAPGALLTAATRELQPASDSIEVFAHGERTAIKQLRAVLADEWKIDRAAMSLSAYWALGRTEDRFQAEKREPIGAIFDS